MHRQASNEDHLITAVNELERCVSDATLNSLRTLSRPLIRRRPNLFVRNLDVNIYKYESIPWKTS